jgi:acetyl esterase
LALQVLFYPSTNASSTDYGSYREFGANHVLTRKAVETFREFYLPDRADWKRPEASPLLSEDLSDMPQTLIVAAGCDPLRDEGKAYAQRLLSDSVPVTYHVEPGMIHGFLNFFNLHPACSPYAEATLGYAAGFIRQVVQP